MTQSTGSLYHQVLRELKARGVRVDDAAAAAEIAERALRQRRNELMVMARAGGLSYRHIARVFDLDVALVHRVLTRGDGKSTPPAPILPTAA